MLPLLPLVVGGGIAVALRWKRNRNKRADANQQNQNTPRNIREEVTALAVATEARYQQFVQERIDPLLGQERDAQLQELLSDADLALTEDERSANQVVAWAATTFSLAILSRWIWRPLMSMAILLGLAGAAVSYGLAWKEWQKNKRIGNLHLLCIYVTFMWLGGYAMAGALGMLLFGVALKMKTLTENKSRNNLIDVFHLQPKQVWVRANGAEIEIPFEQLKSGDILVLQAGQIVPVDGIIVSGAATVDQHMLTGEAQPVEKTVHDSVFSSTVLLSGMVDVRVEKTGIETTAGQIGEILNQSAQYNTSTALKGLELADRFALPTLALSTASWPLIGPAGAISLMGANSTINAQLTGPLSVLNFLNLAATQGVLIKDGSGLERLNDVDTVVFDKTGTLTLEQPHVVQVHTLNGSNEAQILTLAAAAEARQTHPIARAILEAARAQKLDLPAIDEAHYEVGYGLKVQLVEADRHSESLRVSGKGPVSDEPQNGSDASRSPAFSNQHGRARNSENPRLSPPLIRVGSGRFMTMEGIALSEQVQALTDSCQAQGHSLVMVAVDDELVGCIELQPTVRPEAQLIIDGLRARGLSLYIISGDQEAPTRKLAQDLGMTGYFADILPEAKADLVEQLQESGRQVCFIGDGINDAIAMRKASVSISLRGATTAATDTAQIVLMQGTLNQLLYLFQLAEEFERNLKQNFHFAAGVSLVSVTGILLAGFTFVATEVLYTVSLLGGVTIAMKPLLRHKSDFLKKSDL